MVTDTKTNTNKITINVTVDALFYFIINFIYPTPIFIFLKVFFIYFRDTTIFITYCPTTSHSDLATPFLTFILTPRRKVTVYTPPPPSRVNINLSPCPLWGYYVNRNTNETGPVHIMRFYCRLIHCVQGVLFGKSVVSLVCYF